MLYWRENPSKDKMIDRVNKLCKDNNLVTAPELLLDLGLDELFYNDGTAMEEALHKEIERGNKYQMFGNAEREALWATYAGDV